MDVRCSYVSFINILLHASAQVLLLFYQTKSCFSGSYFCSYDRAKFLDVLDVCSWGGGGANLDLKSMKAAHNPHDVLEIFKDQIIGYLVEYC